MKLTNAQKYKLKEIYGRNWKKPNSFLAFRRSVRPMLLGRGCVLVPFAGMILGVEPDGHAHS